MNDDAEVTQVQSAADRLARVKQDLLELLTHRNTPRTRAEFEEIVAVIDFMEWIGATIAPRTGPIVYAPKPRTAAWFFSAPPLTSMSDHPQIAGLAECRPPLPVSGFDSLPRAGESARRELGRAIAELALCTGDLGVATCARLQQLYVAIGGADPWKAEQDYAIRNPPPRIGFGDLPNWISGEQ